MAVYKSSADEYAMSVIWRWLEKTKRLNPACKQKLAPQISLTSACFRTNLLVCVRRNRL
jgi:hypothetical protein